MLKLSRSHTLAALGAIATFSVAIAPAFAATTYHLAVSGSTTVFPILDNQAAAAAPADTDFQSGWSDIGTVGGDTATGIESGGSDTGISDVMMGRDDIGDASRPIGPNDDTCTGGSPKPGHTCTNPPKYLQADIDSWVIATDGISIIDSLATGGLGTTLPGLTVGQLAIIYSCHATNPNSSTSTVDSTVVSGGLTWDQVYTLAGLAAPSGTSGVPVFAVSRATSSGTYGDYLKFIGVSKANEQACANDPAAGQTHPSSPVQRAASPGGNPEMVSGVKGHPTGSIAYVGLGFTNDSALHIVPVAASGDPSTNGITPTGSSIVNKVLNDLNYQGVNNRTPAYPFGRQLFMNTVKRNSLTTAGDTTRLNNLPRALSVINFITSASGQNGVDNEGSVPLQTGHSGDGITDVTGTCTTSTTHSLTLCPQTIPAFDVNADGVVNINDLSSIGAHWLQVAPSGVLGGWIREDVDGNGAVNINDLGQVGAKWLHTWSKWLY